MDFKKLVPLPPIASAHGHEVDLLIYLVHLLMLILFVGWAIYFCYVLYRFREKKNPKASYGGLHSKTSTYVEVAVAVIEIVLLAWFSLPFWIRQINAFPNRTDTIEIRVVAEQFAWNFHYPGRDGKFGKTDTKFLDKQSNPLGIDPADPQGKDDVVTINQLYAPIGRPLLMYVTSKDVIHALSIQAMRVKQDVNPGARVPVWFTPTKTGKYEIGCAQLCGIGHYRMKGYLTVQTPEEYEKWMSEQSAASSESGNGEDNFWN